MSILVALPEDLYAVDAFAAFDGGTSFSAGNSRAMAWAAQLAYEDDDPAKIDRVLGRWGYSRAGLLAADVRSALPVTSTRVLLFADATALVVAFKGTDPLVLANWITDFTVVPQHSGIHSGFEMALDAVWPTLAALIDARGAGKRVFFTGHSLGAALTALAALRKLQDQAHASNIAGIYTFGMPRTGDAQFAVDYGRLIDRTYRFVYGNDVVPQVPPTTWNFTHVGHRFTCASGSRFDTSSLALAPIDDDPPFLGGVAPGILSVFKLPPAPAAGAQRVDAVGQIIALLPPPLRDHLPDRYCSAV